MKNLDNEDIFSDFEGKVKGKEDTEHHAPHKHIDEKELLNKKFLDEKQALEEKYKKEMHTLEEKEKKAKQSKPNTGLSTTERIVYIAIIIVLLGYTIIDLSFYHKEGSSISEKSLGIDAVKGDESSNKSATDTEQEEAQETEAVEDENAAQEEGSLSGAITLAIDKIYMEVAEDKNDTGYITKIDFTINNGKSKVLSPIVDVYIFDTEIDESWETRSRGHYTYAIGIKPGSTHTGTIDLSPKTYKNLNVKKSIRVALEDAEDGFITAVNDAVTIS